MQAMRQVLNALSPWDWLALVFFFVAWIGYARFAHRRADTQPSLLAASNRVRRQWMLQATYREVRVVDGVVVQSLSASPSFFASTSLLIIGGLLAALGASEQAGAIFRELPFAARTTTLVLDMKLVLMAGIFVYAFFRFTWSLRLYSMGALLVAAAPEFRLFEQGDPADRERFADRAGGVVGMAAEAFNDGLRGYYFAFAAAAWLFAPLAFALASAGVVWVLYQREFHSEAVTLMRG
jgi:uncharacterized membrane protein